MEKETKDGKVAVLYSPGYGSGWFSWNDDFPQLLFHPKLVKMVEEGKKDQITKELVKELLNIDIYTGGAKDLKIQWLSEGTQFRIDEYDGFELIVVLNHKDFLIA